MGDVKNFRFKTSRGNYDIPVKDTTARERIGDLDELHTQHKDNLVNAINDLEGGSGGTSDYTELNNKPSINGVTLVGNKTTEDLGIEGVTDYDELDNKPSINGKELEGNLSTEDLEIDYDDILNRPVESGDLDLDAVVDPLPTVVSKSNVVVDERGTEYEDGIYIKEIDGTAMYKPVYKKTVECGALPNNADKNVAHGISNLDTVCSIGGCVMNSSKEFTPVPTIDPSTLNWCIGTWGTATTITIRTKADYSAYSGRVELKYTKTTDEWQVYEEDTQ